MDEIVDLFEEHCGGDVEIYWEDRTPQEYCVARLKQVNGSQALDDVICGMLKFWEQKKLFNPKKTARYLNDFFLQDGQELVFRERPANIASNKKIKRLPYFEVHEIIEVPISDELQTFLQQSTISDHLEKAKRRLVERDYDGAISIAYTLVESFIKAMLRQMPPPFNSFNEDEGDIRALHKVTSKALNLNPAGESINQHLKPVVQGLITQIGGLYGLANKFGDRHDPKHKAHRHHAKLPVNVALTYCEFVLEVFENQREPLVKELAL